MAEVTPNPETFVSTQESTDAEPAESYLHPWIKEWFTAIAIEDEMTIIVILIIAAVVLIIVIVLCITGCVLSSRRRRKKSLKKSKKADFEEGQGYDNEYYNNLMKGAKITSISQYPSKKTGKTKKTDDEVKDDDGNEYFNQLKKEMGNVNSVSQYQRSR